MLPQVFREKCELADEFGHLGVLQSLKDVPHLILTGIDGHAADPLSKSLPGAVVEIQHATREAEKVGVAVNFL